jgi:hypothetical protein
MPVNVGILCLESHVITSVFTIQQTFTLVCRRSNYYLVMFFTKKSVIFFATGITTTAFI